MDGLCKASLNKLLPVSQALPAADPMSRPPTTTTSSDAPIIFRDAILRQKGDARSLSLRIGPKLDQVVNAVVLTIWSMLIGLATWSMLGGGVGGHCREH